MSSPVLTDFVSVPPRHAIAQRDFREAMVRVLLESKLGPDEGAGAGPARADLERDLADFVEKYTVDPSQIETRYAEAESISTRMSFRDDPTARVWEQARGDLNDALLDERTDFVLRTADRVFREVYGPDATPPDDLIHVSCSGYASPSPAQKAVSERSWPTVVTHSYHMGCAGAFPATRIGAGFLASSALYGGGKARVDLVHTEVHSAHTASLEAVSSPEQLIIRSLFADGFIKYSMVPQGRLPAGRGGLRVLGFREQIVPKTLEDMTLRVGHDRFHMSLSRRVPLILGAKIQGLCEALCAQAGRSFSDVRGSMLFALHPGGPRIVDFLQERLGLRDDQLRFSRGVLRDRGNMSSATVPHLWKRITEDAVAPGTLVLSAGFGPGLGLHGMLAERV